MTICSRLRIAASSVLILACLSAPALFAQASGSSATVLNAQAAAKVLPSAVFFRGQSASIQARNAGGVKFPDGFFVLATLVDNSGYSTAVAEKYQGYLLTEVPLTISGNTLPPGAYGFGFIAGDKFVVQDIGAHDLFTTASTRDAQLRPAVPLQIKSDDGSFRLYAGRSYVDLTRK